MRGWVGDWFRTVWAWWYWNTRKSYYVLRGRRGQCPCHNPSDSGLALKTECEAVLGWNQPERFRRRVCPVLIRDDNGAWVCGVGAAEVRPYWGRLVLGLGGGVLGLALLLGTGALVIMRSVGIPVTLRQVFWPPAWGEVQQVRAHYFAAKARSYYSLGKYREAAHALTVAHEMDTADYGTGLALAQFYQAGRPDLVDAFYARLMANHPLHRAETAQAWLRSLLVRGRLSEVSKLAYARLIESPSDVGVWVHALLFSTRLLHELEFLEQVAANPQLPASVRDLIRLEVRLRTSKPDEAVGRLNLEPITTDFAYARIHRIKRLIDWGDTDGALVLLNDARTDLGGRDVVRLALAAYAVGHNDVALQREVAQLLSEGKKNGAAGPGLVALHLINHPNEQLSVHCIDALLRLERDSTIAYNEAVTAVYCAAALNGQWVRLAQIRECFSPDFRTDDVVWLRGEALLARNETLPETLLLLINPMSLELSYALLEHISLRGGMGQAVGPGRTGK